MNDLLSFSSPQIVGGLPPPPGVIPNFVNPYSLQETFIASLVVMLCLTTITTALRLYTKLFIIKTHGWEDYTLYLAWLGFIAYSTVPFLTLPFGTGIHQWNVPIQHVIRFAQLGNVIEIIYPPLIFITKLSILLQFIRIFIPTHKGKTYYAIQLMIWVNLLYFTAAELLSIFQCTPRSRIWNPFITGKCVNYRAVNLATAIFNVISDFLILLLPMAWIWRLKMSTSRKLRISAVFAVGAFACAMTILRLIWSIRYVDSRDDTYTLSSVALSTLGEVASGILCANLPVLPRLFKEYAPKFQAHYARLRGKSQGSSSSGRSDTSKAMVSRENQDIPPFRKNNYVELPEQNCGFGPKPGNLGETRPAGNPGGFAEHREMCTPSDLDCAYMEEGLQRTARVDHF